jgi:hypothetical protein
MITPDLGEVLTSAVRSGMTRLRTGIPAEVKSYDPATNTCEVSIVVDNFILDQDSDKTYETFPDISGVPVLWPRGGGYVMTLPLAPGDFVWLAFSELPLAEWRTTGQHSQPVDTRRHSIGYPYATPGAWPDAKPLATSDVTNRTTKMVIGEDGGEAQVVIDRILGTVSLGRTPTDFVALASKVDAVLSALSTAVPVAGDGGAALVAAVAAALVAAGGSTASAFTRTK